MMHVLPATRTQGAWCTAVSVTLEAARGTPSRVRRHAAAGRRGVSWSGARTFAEDDARVALLAVDLISRPRDEHVLHPSDDNSGAREPCRIAGVHVPRDRRDLGNLRGEACGVRPRVALQIVDARSGDCPGSN